MNIGGIIAVSVFVGAALFLFVPDMLERWRFRGSLIIGQPDYIALISSVVGVWIISLALELTLLQGVLVWLGMFVYQIKGS